MSGRIERGGKSYRVRRGKLVEIPPKWVGQTVAAQTIANRPSKAIHKLRKTLKNSKGLERGPELQRRRLDAGRRADGDD